MSEHRSVGGSPDGPPEKPAAPLASPPPRPAPGQLTRPGGTSRPPVSPTAVPRAAPNRIPGPPEGPAAPRWPRTFAALGAGVVAVAVGQVLLALLEGLTSYPDDATNVPVQLYLRIGQPFGGLGGGAVLLLLIGLLLAVVPSVVMPPGPEGPPRLTRAVIPVVGTFAAVIAVGSVLAVLYSLDAYSMRGLSTPPRVRLNLATFLFGSIGLAAVTISASMVLAGLLRRPGG